MGSVGDIPYDNTADDSLQLTTAGGDDPGNPIELWGVGFDGDYTRFGFNGEAGASILILAIAAGRLPPAASPVRTRSTRLIRRGTTSRTRSLAATAPLARKRHRAVHADAVRGRQGVRQTKGLNSPPARCWARNWS